MELPGPVFAAEAMAFEVERIFHDRISDWISDEMVVFLDSSESGRLMPVIVSDVSSMESLPDTGVKTASKLNAPNTVLSAELAIENASRPVTVNPLDPVVSGVYSVKV
jgi:hypothetical protein